MANEIQILHDDAAETVYAIIRETAATGRWWHVPATAEFIVFAAAQWAHYAITLAEVEAASSGNVAVQGTWPAALTAVGFYWLDVYVQAGANPAQTDFRVCSCLWYWNGTTLVPAGGAADARQIAASVAAVPGQAGGLALVGSSMIVPNTQKVDVDTIKTKAVVASDTVTFANGTVATAADVGVITTILAGITSLAHWLRGLYNKRAMNSEALTEIQNITGTFDPTTDSAEALRDRGDAAWITATGFATPTNITAASGVSLAASQHVIVDSGTVTSLTNAPPDSAGVTTLLARIGAFTGTTVNTVLGFFRALFRKDSGATLPSDIGGTFDNATDSNEAIRDSQLTQTQVSGGAYDLTNATYVAALKSGLGTVPASGNWAIVGSKMDLADTLNSTGVAALKSGLGTIPASGNWSTVTPDAAGTAASIAATIAGAGWSASTDTLAAIRDAVDATGGLTAQETRNALKLAPSTGTPAPGSVDAELDAIGLKTATIGSGRVTYASTVGEASLATLWAGDDYRAADGTQFSITVTDYAGPSLATATAVLRIMDSVQYLSAVDGVSVAADLQVAATIAIDGTTITFAADLTAAQTAAFETSPPQLAHNYVYEFVATLSNIHVGYRTHGRLTVKKAIAAGV